MTSALSEQEAILVKKSQLEREHLLKEARKHDEIAKTLRSQARELGPTKLAEKLEVSKFVIHRIFQERSWGKLRID